VVASLSNSAVLHKRYILITGTSTGIGRACALRLARAGFAVIAGVRTEGDGESIKRAGEGASGGIHPIVIDVTEAGSVQRAAVAVRDVVGAEGLCGLVNNAGICVVGPVESVGLVDWRYQFEVNLFGAIAVTQAMLPLIRLHNSVRGKGAGRVINMGSITGEISTPLFGAYSASKHALRAVSDSLRMELMAEGILVSLIVPGTIQSEIWRKEKAGVAAILGDDRASELYGEMIRKVSEYVFSCAAGAAPADRVAQVVEKCLNSRRPRGRYRVGWEADVGSAAKKFIPDGMFNFLMRKTMHVPSGE
jgi:NAD(P)-dependent dehydrogenase (short-subunit alcohol dehydrogenase family)